MYLCDEAAVARVQFNTTQDVATARLCSKHLLQKGSRVRVVERFDVMD